MSEAMEQLRTMARHHRELQAYYDAEETRSVCCAHRDIADQLEALLPALDEQHQAELQAEREGCIDDASMFLSNIGNLSASSMGRDRTLSAAYGMARQVVDELKARGPFDALERAKEEARKQAAQEHVRSAEQQGWGGEDYKSAIAKLTEAELAAVDRVMVHYATTGNEFFQRTSRLKGLGEPRKAELEREP